MYIGIYDMDLNDIHYSFMPSLEAMQMSTYYGNKGDFVELFYNLEDAKRFSKIYVVKNHVNTNFPNELIANYNIEFVGRGFTNGVYKGYEFDSAVANNYLYDEYLKIIGDKRKLRAIEKQTIKDIKKYGFSRLYTNEGLNKKLPIERKIYLYDDCFPNKDGLNLLNSKNYSIIKLVNEIKDDNLNLLMSYAKEKWNYHENKYLYTGKINKELIDYYIQNAKDLKVPISFEIGNYEDGLTSKEAFAYWLNILEYCQINNIKIKIRNKKNYYDYYTDLFSCLCDWNNFNIAKTKIFNVYFIKKYPFWRKTFFQMLSMNSEIDKLTKVNIRKSIEKGETIYNG